MNKLIQAFLSGIFVTFILDFFLFLGVFLHYINFHDIDLYYNILFADNQNGYIFFSLSLLFGFLSVYMENSKIGLAVIGLAFCLVLLTLIEPIGKDMGERMFMKKNTTVQSSKFTYTGDLLYEGREFVFLYDYKYQKILKLNREDLKK